MESLKQNLEEKKFSAIEKEREAKISEEEREKFGGDYSKNPENIKKFFEIGVEKIDDIEFKGAETEVEFYGPIFISRKQA